MASEPSRVVVAGDVRIDELSYETSPGALDGFRWQRGLQARTVTLPGDALLLGRFLLEATGDPVVTYDLPAGARSTNAIRAKATLARLSANQSKGHPTWRVQRFAGFVGPGDEGAAALRIPRDDPDAELVVLDDAGNGFAETQDAWPTAIRQGDKSPIVVLKTRDPKLQSELSNALLAQHAARLVLLLRADDLRECGANISRGLSWERTASDLLRQLGANSALSRIGSCGHVIVTFGIEGAMLLPRNGEATNTRLFYDPLCAEGECTGQTSVGMIGLHTAFTAALCATLSTDGLAGLDDGVRRGLRAARLLQAAGFGPTSEEPDYPKGLFTEAVETENAVSQITVPRLAPESSQAADWSISQTLSGARLGILASDLVIKGPGATARGTPMAKFGLLRSLDRAEIESYRRVGQLIREYAARGDSSRPLCIAAFGPPGSGKSFAVTQIAQSQGQTAVQKIVFNVAQFASPSDLSHALHRVRDVVLSGKLPLAFFDEFDAELDGRPLGWLKYFLAPMQDGEFRDGETVHPIGRAVFVFAGGTSNTFEEFATPSPDAGPLAASAFRAAKGPDFVSRLRGYVNVRGPDPVHDGDRAAILRRALVLRSLFERKAPWLLGREGVAAIDQAVLRAFLRVPRYVHGVRSMEALIEMSQLAGRAGYEQAALPPHDQLQLHIDADAFLGLVNRDVLFGESREAIAKAVHEQFRRDHKHDRDAKDPAMQPWDQLDEQLRESNRQQADDIGRKLLLIGYEFRPVTTGEVTNAEFSPEEVELLAEHEHARWVEEREAAGWTLGPRDHEAKSSPYLVSWKALEDMDGDPQEWDRQAARNIPKIMANARFEVYRAGLLRESQPSPPTPVD